MCIYTAVGFPVFSWFLSDKSIEDTKTDNVSLYIFVLFVWYYGHFWIIIIKGKYLINY